MVLFNYLGDKKYEPFEGKILFGVEPIESERR